jgi:hypothetical protein
VHLVLSSDAAECERQSFSAKLALELVALPKSGTGHIDQRRQAINDATVNYLISLMVESLEWNEDEIRLPGSLVMLIRRQLCGDHPDLYSESVLIEKRRNAAYIAAQIFPEGKISVRNCSVPSA